MPSRHRVKNMQPHELDFKGIIVAFAVLVSLGVFAGGRDQRPAHEDQQPLSASLHIEPTFAEEKTETVRPPYDAEKASPIPRTGSVHPATPLSHALLQPSSPHN
jgi:hypothetical protein